MAPRRLELPSTKYRALNRDAVTPVTMSLDGKIDLFGLRLKLDPCHYRRERVRTEGCGLFCRQTRLTGRCHRCIVVALDTVGIR